MIKSFKKIALGAALLVSATYFSQEISITKEQLPQSITQYIHTNFPGKSLSKISKEKKMGKMEYEIYLDNGTKLEFNNSVINEIESTEKLPDAVIPKNILAYTKKNYPQNFITEWKLSFNKHNQAHIVRAAQEGIVFSFCYGMEVMQHMGMNINKIHAGKANMFLSPMFRDTLAGVSGATIELYDTDGSVGAAKGAGIGAGIYKDNVEAFSTLKKLGVIEPDEAKRDAYLSAYAEWKEELVASINK